MKIDFENFKSEVLNDYYIACLSQELSFFNKNKLSSDNINSSVLVARRELAQIAMAKTFINNDLYLNYYSDFTFMLATKMLTENEFFTQLFDNNKLSNLNITKNKMFEILSSEAQKSYLINCSVKPDNIVFCNFDSKSNITNDLLKALIDKKVPVAISIFDNGKNQNGINLLNSISTNENEIVILNVKSDNYANLCEVYKNGVEKCRKYRMPVIFYVEEINEEKRSSIDKMRRWLIDTKISTELEVSEIENNSRTMLYLISKYPTLKQFLKKHTKS